MPLANDLLEQAKHLALRERGKPKQASLKRAVSTAYYALFHLLVREASNRVTPTQPPHLVKHVQRAFDHTNMKSVCSSLENAQSKLGKLFALPPSSDLLTVASSFVRVQTARNGADYSATQTLLRVDALNEIERVREAFEAWSRIRLAPEANVFLLALLLGQGWPRL